MPLHQHCSHRVLSHQSLLWHHRPGLSSLPRLRTMHSCILVSSLPMSLPPPPVLACPAVPSTRRGAAVRRCSLLLVSSDHAPLQTLHMNLNLWPRISVPETLPTLRLTGDVGDASAFRVWGTLSLVHDTTASYLFPRTLCCIFLGFLTNNPPWQFYQPASRRLMSSQDVTFAG
ncbi:unnamed protein product [Closterium sp. NIES-53]